MAKGDIYIRSDARNIRLRGSELWQTVNMSKPCAPNATTVESTESTVGSTMKNSNAKRRPSWEKKK